MQLIDQGFPLIKDAIEEAEIPRLENATDPDDEPFEMEEHLHLVLLILEDDELERE